MIAIYNDKLVLKSSGKVFTLKSDLLKTITDFKSNATDLTYAERIVSFSD